MEFVVGAMVALVLGVIPGAVASYKGRDFLGWWVYGALLFAVATPHAFLLPVDQKRLDIRKAQEGFGRCPSCAEMVRNEAIKCRYCQAGLVS